MRLVTRSAASPSWNTTLHPDAEQTGTRGQTCGDYTQDNNVPLSQVPPTTWEEGYRLVTSTTCRCDARVQPSTNPKPARTDRPSQTRATPETVPRTREYLRVGVLNGLEKVVTNPSRDPRVHGSGPPDSPRLSGTLPSGSVCPPLRSQGGTVVRRAGRPPESGGRPRAGGGTDRGPFGESLETLLPPGLHSVSGPESESRRSSPPYGPGDGPRRTSTGARDL